MSTKNYQLGQLVQLKGLNNAPYNGKFGRVVPFPSYELCYNGRYLVQLIDDVAPPLLSQLSVKPENMEHVCIRCHKNAEKLLFCRKCRYVIYCDRECQRIDWERHEKECRSCGHTRDVTKNPLMLAVEVGDLRLVQKLVQEGIDVNMTTNTTNATALLVAAMRGNLPVVQYLLHHGAEKNKTDNDGVSPLYMAALNGHFAVVKYLVEQGVDTDKVRDNGTSSLLIAAQNGHLEVVKCLLEQAADKDKVDNNGATPLFMAAQNGHLTVVRCLVEHGTDKDKTTNEGLTPLQAAVVGGHTEIVTYLRR